MTFNSSPQPGTLDQYDSSGLGLGFRGLRFGVLGDLVLLCHPHVSPYDSKLTPTYSPG